MAINLKVSSSNMTKGFVHSNFFASYVHNMQSFQSVHPGTRARQYQEFAFWTSSFHIVRGIGIPASRIERSFQDFLFSPPRHQAIDMNAWR